MEEVLDLVNKQDIIIGQHPRSYFDEKGLSGFRAINVFLKNNKGELWIPRRTAYKKLFPLSLDTSVGGHVKSGESYEQAFVRELKEELNLDASKVSYKMIGYFTPPEHNLAAFMQVYEIETNETPQFNNEDFIEGKWIAPKDLAMQIENGDKTKSDLPKLLKLIYNV